MTLILFFHQTNILMKIQFALNCIYHSFLKSNSDENLRKALELTFKHPKRKGCAFTHQPYLHRLGYAFSQKFSVNIFKDFNTFFGFN